MSANLPRRRAFLTMAAGLAASMGVAACANGGAGGEARTIARLPSFQELTTPIEVVVAFHDIFVNDSLLKAGFFEDATLRRLFGTQATMTRSKELSFGSELIHGEASLPGRGAIWVHAIVIGPQVRTGSISLQHLSPTAGISYEYVARLFQFDRITGNRVPNDEAVPSPHSGPYPASTHRHGNKEEAFAFAVGSYHKSLSCRFGPDGSLASLSIGVTQTP